MQKWKFSMAFLIFALLLGILVLFGIYASESPDLILAQMWLAEVNKPTVIYHSEILTTTRIISHPKPKLNVDDKILRDLNCPLLEDGVRYCSSIEDSGQSESLGCFSIYTEDSLLGGLNPKYPIVGCSRGNFKYVYQRGCNLGVGNGYVLERQGKIELIDSFAKLKSTFAPIDSEDEALSYAMAATGYSAFYGTQLPSDSEYFVESLENTHVQKNGNEYIVRLYNYVSCACRKHETNAIDIAVSLHGDIHEIYRELVYRDAKLSCLD